MLALCLAGGVSKLRGTVALQGVLGLVGGVSKELLVHVDLFRGVVGGVSEGLLVLIVLGVVAGVSQALCLNCKGKASLQPTPESFMSLKSKAWSSREFTGNPPSMRNKSSLE